MKTKSAFLTCLLAALFYAPAAHASVIMTLEQAGPDVVATGSGTVDLAGLSFVATAHQGPTIDPSRAFFLEGNGGSYAGYNGSISGPTSFGSGNGTSASSGTGNPLAFEEVSAGNGDILVPVGYVSGTPLSSTATWDNTSLARLGVTTGTYTYTWGSGAETPIPSPYTPASPPHPPSPSPHRPSCSSSEPPRLLCLPGEPKPLWLWGRRFRLPMSALC